MPSKYNEEIVRKFLEEHNIKSTTELYKIPNGRSIYDWCRRNDKFSELGLVKGERISVNKPKMKGRTREHYDILKSLPYLEKWAKEEGTTVKYQAYKYSLGPEWEEYERKLNGEEEPVVEEEPEVEEEVEEEQEKHLSPLKSIRKKCLDCCCGSPNEVKLCHVIDCPLYVYRLGKNPFRKKELSEEQREDARERINKMWERKKAKKC